MQRDDDDDGKSGGNGHMVEAAKSRQWPFID